MPHLSVLFSFTLTYHVAAFGGISSPSVSQHEATHLECIEKLAHKVQGVDAMNNMSFPRHF